MRKAVRCSHCGKRWGTCDCGRTIALAEEAATRVAELKFVNFLDVFMEWLKESELRLVSKKRRGRK